MREMKLTGRERSIIRAIGLTESTSGLEIQKGTDMDPHDLIDTLNGLLAGGYIESTPFHNEIEVTQISEISFEVNPAYLSELSQALCRR
jgi:DNA-binding MarR family transcriptional regulator